MLAVPTGSPRSPLAAAGDCAYVGYRPSRGATTLRLPGGEHVVLGRDDERALASAVLADRLGSPPDPALLQAFRDGWVAVRARGEFVWPVAAVDDWLAAAAATAPRPRARTPFPVLWKPLRAALHTPSPRGGH